MVARKASLASVNSRTDGVENVGVQYSGTSVPKALKNVYSDVIFISV